jgi:choloylglycine hydrolase
MKKGFFWLLCLALLPFQYVLACTDFRVSAKDGNIIVARSMEFAADLESRLISTPQKTAFKNTTPNGQSGLSWQSQYGYVLLDVRCLAHRQHSGWLK